MSDKKNKRDVVVGIKQTLKMVEKNCISEVLVARDADFYVTASVVEAARSCGIPIIYVESKKKLGRMCGIEIGAATAGRIRKDDGGAVAE